MSDKKFDDKIRETLEGHEPNVQPNWGRMKERIAAAAAVGAIGIDIAGSRLISQLSIGCAVVVGSASLWFAQQYFFNDDEILDNEQSKVNVIDDESGLENDNNEAILIGISENDIESITVVDDVEIVNESVNNTSSLIENSSDIIVELFAIDEEKDRSEDMHLETIVDVDLPFEASVKEACVGVEVDFVLDITEQNMSFLWNFGDGCFSSEAHPSHVYNEEGVYDVTLSVRSPGAGVIQTRTIDSLIEVHSQPEAKMSFELPRIVIAGSLEVELNDDTKDANSSTWIVDGEVAGDNKPKFSVPGTYNLNLIAANKFGCKDRIFEEIEFGDRQTLRAPARFSPDNDGRYDSFMPFGLYRLVDDWELVISDDLGAEVYATKDFNSPWNGKDSSGNLAENGAMFYWTVVCTDHSGVQRLYTDAVRVER